MDSDKCRISLPKYGVCPQMSEMFKDGITIRCGDCEGVIRTNADLKMEAGNGTIKLKCGTCDCTLLKLE